MLEGVRRLIELSYLFYGSLAGQCAGADRVTQERFVAERGGVRLVSLGDRGVYVVLLCDYSVLCTR